MRFLPYAVGVASTVMMATAAQSQTDEDTARTTRGGEIVTRIMSRDQNKDGKVTKDEMPLPMQRILERADSNKDGAIDRAEAERFQQRMRVRQAAGRARPGGRSKPNQRPNSRQPAVEDAAADTATHEEIEPLPLKIGELKSLCLLADGRLLVADAKAGEIKIVSAAGEEVGSIDPGFHPEVLGADTDANIYCGGDGMVAKLTAKGELVKKVALPEDAGDSSAPSRGGNRPPSLSGLAIADDAVYVTFGSGWSVGSKAQLYRFDRDLENPQMIGEGFRGCCQHCDITFRDGVLYMAENSAFRVVLFDAKGKQIKKWGSKSRDDVKLFNGCCNPMNICFGSDGTLYTAESGVGRVKRYSPEGEYLGLVGYLDVERFLRGSRHASQCCHIPIAVTPDGDRVYVSDVNENIIRVLRRKQ